MIETSFPGQLSNLEEKVFALGAADTTIRHFDNLFLRMRKRSVAGAHKRGVDIDLAHVVDDHRDFL